MANSRRKEDGEIGKYDKTKSLFFQHTRNHRGCDADIIIKKYPRSFRSGGAE